MILFFVVAEKICRFVVLICIVFMGKGSPSYSKNPSKGKKGQISRFSPTIFLHDENHGQKNLSSTNPMDKSAGLKNIMLTTNNFKQFILYFSLFGHFFNFLAKNDHETGVS